MGAAMEALPGPELAFLAHFDVHLYIGGQTTSAARVEPPGGEPPGAAPGVAGPYIGEARPGTWPPWRPIPVTAASPIGDRPCHAYRTPPRGTR